MSIDRMPQQLGRVLTRRGTAVTFSKSSGTYDGLTDTTTSVSTTSIPGSAIETRGDETQYRSLNLVEGEARTLLFSPTDLSSKPELDMSCTWASAQYSVKNCRITSVTGAPICFEVVIAR